MPIKVSEQDNIYILQPQGPAMAVESHMEIREIFKGLKEKDPQGVVLDLSDVDHIDSLGLGSLISGRLSLRGKCEIRLCCLSNQVESLIRHSRMDLLFPLHDRLSAAIETAKNAKKP